MTRNETPDARCLARYRQDARQLRRHGLEPSDIERTTAELSERVGARWQLKPEAYRPTGVVLGCPLPARLTSRLRRIAALAARWVDEVAGLDAPGEGFAFVPPEAYHITVVNRTHFDATDVAPLSREENRAVERVVSATRLGPIRHRLHGLLLTRSGRLLVPGFACSAGLYALRAALLEGLPGMWVRTPATAHVKLGHVRLRLDGARLDRLLLRFQFAAEHVAGFAAFDDVHTPHGRIPL